MTKPSQFPDAATFASSFGQSVWLMAASKAHQALLICDIERLVSPAILLHQFKIYSKGKQPIAFLSWASVSDEIKAQRGGELQAEDAGPAVGE